jgi:beta-phosphoglucomutase-like phosphatase (HAD superfamily)
VRTKALLFDFDGIVVDTEGPVLQAWQEVYEEHAQVLTLDDWAGCIGTIGGFEPLDHLESLLGGPLPDRAAVDGRRRERQLQLVEDAGLREGLETVLARAAGLGLQVAIVSSDHTSWIEWNLRRVGRSEGWACVNCANGDAARAKPSPRLYEEALETLGLAATEAVVFEDSPNGIRAAKAAGIFCVAVANPVTASLDLSAADLRVESFEEIALDDVLALVDST